MISSSQPIFDAEGTIDNAEWETKYQELMGVEGEIDGWTGEGEMFAVLRQLSAVRPDQPRIVVDFGPIRRPRFGENAPDPVDPWTLQRQIGEILAS